FLGQRKKSEQIDMRAGRKNCRKVKRGGQDSDHGCVGIVQPDRFARNVRIGSKAPLPQSVTEHHHMRTIPFAFIRTKLSSHLRLHAQQREEVLRYRHRAQPLRLAVPGQLAVAHSVESEVPRDIRERRVSLPKIEKTPDLQRGARQIAVNIRPIRDPQQPAGIAAGDGAGYDLPGAGKGWPGKEKGGTLLVGIFGNCFTIISYFCGPPPLPRPSPQRPPAGSAPAAWKARTFPELFPNPGGSD